MSLSHRSQHIIYLGHVINEVNNSRVGNGSDLTQDACDPNPIKLDLSRFKMNLDSDAWI